MLLKYLFEIIIKLNFYYLKLDVFYKYIYLINQFLIYTIDIFIILAASLNLNLFNLFNNISYFILLKINIEF